MAEIILPKNLFTPELVQRLQRALLAEGDELYSLVQESAPEVLRALLKNRQVGYLPENPAFFDYLSAEEYLTLARKIYRMDAARLRQSAEAVLHRHELWDARKRPMRGYSKGMVQRVGLAQVLPHDPQICILDEPMSGLDPLGRALVKELILELKAQGKSIFFSTHITTDVEEVCDRVGVIVQGRLQRVESVATIHRQGIVDYRLLLKKRLGEGNYSAQLFVVI